jgi:hypothetical protein
MKLYTAIKKIIKYVEKKHPEATDCHKILQDYLSEIEEEKIKKREERNKRKKERKRLKKKYQCFTTKEGYKEYLKTDVWLNKRDYVIEKRGAVCEGCGSTKNIRVHHTYYWRSVLNGKRTTGLRVVCEDCHSKIHNEEKKLLENKIEKTRNKAILKATATFLPKCKAIGDFISDEESLKKLGAIAYYQSKNKVEREKSKYNKKAVSLWMKKGLTREQAIKIETHYQNKKRTLTTN